MAQRVKILAALPDDLCWVDPQNLNSGRRDRSCRLSSDLHMWTPTHVYRKECRKGGQEGRKKNKNEARWTEHFAGHMRSPSFNPHHHNKIIKQNKKIENSMLTLVDNAWTKVSTDNRVNITSLFGA